MTTTSPSPSPSPSPSLSPEDWAAALESGNYTQIQGRLHTDTGFCCLGVLCEISQLGTWKRDATNTHSYQIDTNGSLTTDVALVPRSIRERIHLATADGDFLFSSLPLRLRLDVRAAARKANPNYRLPRIVSLAALNDNNVPFPLIAQIIRAKPKWLFRPGK